MTAFTMLDRLLGRRPVERFWSYRGRIAVRVSGVEYERATAELARAWANPVTHWGGPERHQSPYWGTK